MGVAVPDKGEHRTVLSVRALAGRKPDLAGAALHLVSLVALVVVERNKPAAQLDHVAVAIVPGLEQRKVIDDLVHRHERGRCGGGFRHTDYIVTIEASGHAPIEKSPDGRPRGRPSGMARQGSRK